MQFWLHPLCFGCAEPFEIVDPIRASRRLDLLDPGDLLLAGGDDQLADRGMRHAMLTAIGVEPLAPLDAAARLEAPFRVIEPAMDDLAVARGGLETDRVGAFEDDDLMPGQGQGARRGEPDDPGADHHRFDFVHPPLAPCSRDAMLAASR